MIGVPLGGSKARGRVAWVSEHRYDLVMQHRWHVMEWRRANGRINGPYARTKIKNTDGRWVTVGMHQLIMGCTGVDHRNGYGLDNTDPNLRKATDGQNQHNQGPRSGTSRYKGVSWVTRRRKWQAAIQVDGRSRHLGRFTDEIVAARAYDAAAIEAHGEFAQLNFPQVASPAAKLAVPPPG